MMGLYPKKPVVNENTINQGDFNTLCLPNSISLCSFISKQLWRVNESKI